MTSCQICKKGIDGEITWKDPLLSRSEWQYFHFNCLMRGLVSLLNIPSLKSEESLTPLMDRKIKADHGIYENKKKRKFDDTRTNI